MSKKNSITMFGSAAVAAVPDRMNVSLAVEVRHEQAEGAYRSPRAGPRNWLPHLQSSAPGAKITTTGIGLRARTAWRNDENVLVGYEADTTLQLNQPAPRGGIPGAGGGGCGRRRFPAHQLGAWRRSRSPSVAYAQGTGTGVCRCEGRRPPSLPSWPGAPWAGSWRSEETVIARGPGGPGQGCGHGFGLHAGGRRRTGIIRESRGALGIG